MLNPTGLTAFFEGRLPAALDLLRRMVDMNSFTANRDGVNRLGRFTAESFASLGFTAEFVPSVNPDYGDHLVLTRPGRTSRSVAMVSHLDTVFPPEEARNNFRWLIEGDRAYGPGTHDIKGGTGVVYLFYRLWRGGAHLRLERRHLHMDFATMLVVFRLSATLVGQNFGAGKPERAEQAVWRAGFYNMIFLGSIGPRGVFTAITIARSTYAVVSATLFKRGKWKLKKV